MPFAELRAIAELPEDTLRSQLAHLHAAEFLYEVSLFPETEYTFKHALTHEVAYSSVLRDRRRALHVKLVAAIETLRRDRLDEQVERLAHHAVRGEMWERAVLYLHRAGAKAFARSANREAASYYEEALSALSRVPESRETKQQAIALRFDQRNAMQLLGQIEKAIDLLREAERPYRPGMDRRQFLLTSLAGSVVVPLAAEARSAFLTTKMPGPQVAEGFNSDRSLAP